VQIFELDDVVALLRREVKAAGGQVAWSKTNHVDRTVVNRVLKGRRPPTPGIIAALSLGVVFARDKSQKNKAGQDPAAGYASLSWKARRAVTGKR
jgi:hypothetical protein